MEAALSSLLQSILGSYVTGLEHFSAEFPLTLRDLTLKEQQINKELAAGGAFPFDIANGKIGHVSVTPSWNGGVELALNNLVVNFNFNTFRAMKGAMHAATVQQRPRKRPASVPRSRAPNPRLGMDVERFPPLLLDADEWEVDTGTEILEPSRYTRCELPSSWLQSDLLPTGLRNSLQNLTNLLASSGGVCALSPAARQPATVALGAPNPMTDRMLAGTTTSQSHDLSLGPEVAYTPYETGDRDDSFVSLIKNFSVATWAPMPFGSCSKVDAEIRPRSPVGRAPPRRLTSPS